MIYRKIRKDRDSVMGFSVAPDEKQAIQAEASRRDMNVSDFCRMVLLESIAEREPETDV